MKKILILGATSSIAEYCARLWAKESAEFLLVARDREKLGQVANDLKARGATRVETHLMDAREANTYAQLFSGVSNFGDLDIALVAYGVLPDQSDCEQSPQAATDQFNINATSTIALLTHLALIFEKQKRGTIAVISSVAGDRGRASNFHYGASKAAVSTYCEGLNAKLRKSGVNVLTIKPGFVATPMTRHLNLPAALTASPEKVATDIIRAIRKKRNMIYTPFWWGWIMLVIKNIPAPIFRRLKF